MRCEAWFCRAQGEIGGLANRHAERASNPFGCKDELDGISKLVRHDLLYEIGAEAALPRGLYRGSPRFAPIQLRQPCFNQRPAN